MQFVLVVNSLIMFSSFVCLLVFFIFCALNLHYFYRRELVAIFGDPSSTVLPIHGVCVCYLHRIKPPEIGNQLYTNVMIVAVVLLYVYYCQFQGKVGRNWSGDCFTFLLTNTRQHAWQCVSVQPMHTGVHKIYKCTHFLS